MDREEVEESIDFPYIHEFNSMKTISLLGSQVSDLSKQELVEIGRTIGAYGKEQEAQIGSYSHQKSGVGEHEQYQSNSGGEQIVGIVLLLLLIPMCFGLRDSRKEANA